MPRKTLVAAGKVPRDELRIRQIGHWSEVHGNDSLKVVFGFIGQAGPDTSFGRLPTLVNFLHPRLELVEMSFRPH